jgi:hypothetical protein
VPVPALPLAYLVLIKTNFTFGRLETIFYLPTSARDLDQLIDGRLFRPVGQIVGVL